MNPKRYTSFDLAKGADMPHASVVKFISRCKKYKEFRSTESIIAARQKRPGRDRPEVYFKMTLAVALYFAHRLNAHSYFERLLRDVS